MQKARLHSMSVSLMIILASWSASVSGQCPGPYMLANGESYTLSTEAGLTDIQWLIDTTGTYETIAGATSQNYIATVAGNYKYTATDGSGCPAELCCPISLLECEPQTYYIANGESYTLSTEAGLTGIQWLIDTTGTYETIAGATSQDYIATVAGNYKYTATDGSGCPAELCCPISLLECPDNINHMCLGESYTLTAEAGLSNIQWFIDTAGIYETIAGATNQNYIATVAGNYKYTATDGSGCPAELCCPINIQVHPQPDVTTTDGNICEGLDIDLNTLMTNVGGVAADTAWFSSLADATANTGALSSSVVSPAANTKYYVRLTGQANPTCYDVDSLTITVNETQVSLTQACNDNGTTANDTDDYFTIELTATNATPGASGQYEVYNGADLLATGTYGNSVAMEWRDAANTLRFLADGSSTYTLTVQDADSPGCAASAVTNAGGSCSNCPPPTCPPVLVTKIPAGAD